MSTMRIVSIGKRKNRTRLAYGIGFAIGEAGIVASEAEQRRVLEAFMRWCDEERLVLTFQVGDRS